MLLGAATTMPFYYMHNSQRNQEYISGIERIEGTVIDFSELVIGEMNRSRVLEYMHKDSRFDVLARLALMRRAINNEKEKYSKQPSSARMVQETQ